MSRVDIEQLKRSNPIAGLDRARSQLRAAYPQARAERVPEERADLDPARLLAGERSAAVQLRPSGGDLPSLRGDWRGEPSPLQGVLARAQPRGEERILSRLTLGPAPWGAAGRLLRGHIRGSLTPVGAPVIR